MAEVLNIYVALTGARFYPQTLPKNLKPHTIEISYISWGLNVYFLILILPCALKEPPSKKREPQNPPKSYT